MQINKKNGTTYTQSRDYRTITFSLIIEPSDMQMKILGNNFEINVKKHLRILFFIAQYTKNKSYIRNETSLPDLNRVYFVFQTTDPITADSEK